MTLHYIGMPQFYCVFSMQNIFLNYVAGTKVDICNLLKTNERNTKIKFYTRTFNFIFDLILDF